MNTANDHGERLLSFFIGELTGEEKRAFEAHLAECPECREELKRLRQVWDTIPYSMTEIDPPEQLKSEVLGTILREHPAADALSAMEEENASAPAQAKAPAPAPAAERSGKRKPWRYAAAAVAAVAIGLAGWNGLSDRLHREPGHAELHVPSEMVERYSLKSFDPAVPGATGQAWLMKKGDSMQLVLQTSGLPSLTGNEAYQVWLVKNGERHNCGTFRVDDKGNGIMTYPIDDDDRTFDTIGITLEPDSKGTLPRGKKVLGT
ncbi:anti-sigma factor [Paenibacillus sp. GYB003]|uniref:anti-sigma factor n=1 Tax=Paenibacillus sp. GYB003 TaxID=2994392 RepID=UPI002F968213